MSVFDDIKGKAAGLVSGNEAAIRNGIDKAGDFIDSKTGDKFKDKIDGVQNAAHGFLGKVGGNPNTKTGEGSEDRPA
ncbi:antitoxin [Arthrobacter sp. H14-L1]|uniref:antitoxin n=1 Tax=Arthrobacter sp. H14-L1 TaxID=2996697 RepID=UPI0022709C1A|nr:antitoxin [Arthrobacter sp. H14-L1]MCY0904336.1 antitoxin [Arthrobacter sp. H14-L1]